MWFDLFTHDLFEDCEGEVPPSLMTLADWLAAKHAGEVPFEVDANEGVGVRFSDGATEWLQPAFGDPRSMAGNCAVAADRLEQGRVAVMRTAILDVGSYLLLVPDGDGDIIRVVMPAERHSGQAFPFRPSRQQDTPEAVEALYAWAEAGAHGWLAPSGNAPLDRRQGKALRLSRVALIAALRAAVGPAQAVADLLGLAPFRIAPPGPPPP